MGVADRICRMTMRFTLHPLIKKPIVRANTSGAVITERNKTFKFKITLDRHNAGLKFNCCLRFGPPNFSLPSTFKGLGAGIVLVNIEQCSAVYCNSVTAANCCGGIPIYLQPIFTFIGRRHNGITQAVEILSQAKNIF
jgi:hypothetical protein